MVDVNSETPNEANAEQAEGEQEGRKFHGEVQGEFLGDRHGSHQEGHATHEPATMPAEPIDHSDPAITGDDPQAVTPNPPQEPNQQQNALATQESQNEGDDEKQAKLDHFGSLQGQFSNAVDEMGSSHALRMAKSHYAQAMEWIHRHMHPDQSASMPDAPPPAPPRADQ